MRVGCRSSVRNARGGHVGCGGRVEGVRCTGGTLVRARAVGRTVVLSALGADVRGCARERVGARRVRGACGGAGCADGHAGGVSGCVRGREVRGVRDRSSVWSVKHQRGRSRGGAGFAGVLARGTWGRRMCGGARGRERLAGRSFSRREARWSAQFVRCSAHSIKRFANCGNNANAPVKRTNREGLLHTFLLSEGALVTIVPVTTA